MDHLSKHHRWRREAVELSALFLAVATADLVADVVVHGHDGPALLATSAVAMLAAALFHAWWTHRHTHAPPGPDPSAAPGAAVSGAREATASGPDHLAPGFSLWRIRTTVSDAPGSLASLCGALARLEVNILSLQTHPLSDGTVDEFLVRAPAGVPRAELAGATVAAGGRDTWIDRADTHDLVDVPTRILGLAARTALDAAELPVALRQLFGSCGIRSLPAASATARAVTAHTLDGEVMRLREPSGGVIELTRPQLPFTPTEFARARALVELDAVLGPRLPSHRDVVTLAGDVFTVRRAGPDDRAAALDLHRRCSPESLHRRYHGPVADADLYLGHLLEPRHGQTLAVELADGRIAALAHLMWDGDGAEVAVLVEDAWQRRGLGGELLRRLSALAAGAGVDTVYAVTQASNTAMVAAMRRLEVPLDYQVEDGTLVITAHLERSAEPVPAPGSAEQRN